MPAAAFVEKLNEQIGHEFAAHQQYVAIAVYFDHETLPRLAAFFYAQAVEERNHAMMMVQYLLDADVRPAMPGVAAPRTDFGDIIEPIALALDQEKRVSEQVGGLIAVAREHHDYQSEQFMHWFLREQVEEISTMTDLLRVVQRTHHDPMRMEEYLAREHPGPEGDGELSGAPEAAGGAL